jgi:hypothetical protein
MQHLSHSLYNIFCIKLILKQNTSPSKTTPKSRKQNQVAAFYFPSEIASDKAIGIEAAVVFPYF